MRISPASQRPRYKTVPPSCGYVFPLPIDCDDVFQVGPRHQHRWFSSEVVVPIGIFASFDETILRPFGERLSYYLTSAGQPANFCVSNGRYVLDGPCMQEPPARVPMPTCQITAIEVLVEYLVNQSGHNEPEATRWLEFLRSHEPERVETRLRRCALRGGNA